MWCAAGHPPDQFWMQTPRTFKVVMLGSFDRDRRELRTFAWLASRTGWLAQVDPRKQPSIDTLVGEPAAPAHRQTPAERLAVFRAMQAAGAPMKIRKVA